MFLGRMKVVTLSLPAPLYESGRKYPNRPARRFPRVGQPRMVPKKPRLLESTLHLVKHTSRARVPLSVARCLRAARAVASPPIVNTGPVLVSMFRLPYLTPTYGGPLTTRLKLLCLVNILVNLSL